MERLETNPTVTPEMLAAFGLEGGAGSGAAASPDALESMLLGVALATDEGEFFSWAHLRNRITDQ